MELYTIEINVDGQVLSFKEKPKLASGDKNIDYVQFEFNDDKWDAMTSKYAVFRRLGAKGIPVELDENNKALITTSSIQTKGNLHIGLWGTDGESIQTSTWLMYPLEEGSLKELDVTPPDDIYQTFIADLDAYQTAVSDLASIESRLTTAETTVTNLESRVTTAETTVSNMEDTVDGLVSDVSGMRTTVDGIQTDVTNLQTSVTALESAVPTLQRDVSALQTGVTNLESRLTVISTSVGSLEDRLTTVQTSLTDLEDGLTDAEGRLTTIGNQITDAQTDIEEIQTAIQQNNIVTDVTGGGVSFVNNHVADLSFMTVTDTATGSIASFPDGSGLNAVATEIQIEPKQSGSGTPSPDNVREISGWSSVEVNAFEVNIWDEEWEVGGISDSTGETISSQAVRAKNYNKCLPNTVYYGKYGGSGSLVIDWYDYDKAFILAETITNTTRTSPSNAYYFKLRTTTQYGTTYNHDISINYPSTDTTYHPYNGISTTINLGQTVYGATIYPEEGRGTITMGTVTLDGVTPRQRFTGAWGSTSNGYAVYWNQDIPRTANAISDKFFFSNLGYDNMPLGSFMGGSGVVATWSFILPSSVTSISEANAWLAENPTTVCYELATPIEFTFPPVSIPTLNGTNNVWADSGDISLEYIADIKKYIEKVVS